MLLVIEKETKLEVAGHPLEPRRANPAAHPAAGRRTFLPVCVFSIVTTEYGRKLSSLLLSWLYELSSSSENFQHCC
jgi:hypothetical protein